MDEAQVHIGELAAYIDERAVYIGGRLAHWPEARVHIDLSPAYIPPVLRPPGEELCYILFPQVYIGGKESPVFTSVEIDEELFMKAWQLSGIKTKKAFFEEAMRVYVRLHEQAGVRSLRGKLAMAAEPAKPQRKRGANPR